MKKLFDKSPLTFAILCIVIYVLALGNGDSISEAMGQPKLITVPIAALLTVILWAFIRKNGLEKHVGLCPMRGSWQSCLFFLPLAVITSVNLWNGLTLNEPIFTSLLWVISMCFVGFLEEVIFRGFLFNAMKKDGLKTAVIVSSLTFGVGHMVNLLLGAPLFETLLQLVYASAIGFCYTAIFIKGGSLLPCILSHALVNSMSVFAVQPSEQTQLFIALATTVISLGYGAWLIKGQSKNIC